MRRWIIMASLVLRRFNVCKHVSKRRRSKRRLSVYIKRRRRTLNNKRRLRKKLSLLYVSKSVR